MGKFSFHKKLCTPQKGPPRNRSSKNQWAPNLLKVCQEYPQMWVRLVNLLDTSSFAQVIRLNQHIFRLCRPLCSQPLLESDKIFQRYYSEYLVLENVRMEVQGARLDRILCCRILPNVYLNTCLQVAYTSTLIRVNESPVKNLRGPSPVTTAFQVDLLPVGPQTSWARVDQWPDTGLSETQMAAVCPGDLMEICMTLRSQLGELDVHSVQWLRPTRLGLGGAPSYCQPRNLQGQAESRECSAVRDVHWLNLPDFQDLWGWVQPTLPQMAPQLVEVAAGYGAEDLCYARHTLVAHSPGCVFPFRGAQFQVLPAGHPKVVALKRLGLSRDRESKIQLNVGDHLYLYLSWYPESESGD